MLSGSRRFFFTFPVILRAQHTGKSVQGTKNHRPLAQLSPASTMPMEELLDQKSPASDIAKDAFNLAQLNKIYNP